MANNKKQSKRSRFPHEHDQLMCCQISTVTKWRNAGSCSTHQWYIDTSKRSNLIKRKKWWSIGCNRINQDLANIKKSLKRVEKYPIAILRTNYKNR